MIFRAFNLTLIIFTLFPFLAFSNDIKVYPITTYDVSTVNVPDITTDSGKLEAVKTADLSFGVDEKIKEIYFKDGDEVKKGDLLAKLNDQKALANLNSSQSAYDTQKSLYIKKIKTNKAVPGSISQTELQTQKNDLELAKANLESAKAELSNYYIIAPFDGVLTNFTQSVGSHISANITICK